MPDPDGVPVPVGVDDTVVVVEPEFVPPALDKLAPNVTRGVAEFENDALTVDDNEGVGDDVPLVDMTTPDSALVCECVGEGVIVALSVDKELGDGVLAGVPLPVKEPVSVVAVDDAVALTPLVAEALGVSVAVGERLGALDVTPEMERRAIVTEGVAELDSDALGVDEPDNFAEHESEVDADPVLVRPALLDWVSAATAVGSGDIVGIIDMSLAGDAD